VRHEAARSRALAGAVPEGADAQATLVGKRVGAYVIEAPLGRGAMASVWRARRADARCESPMAVKLLHLSLLGRTDALRFEREGAILARLLDAGLKPQGQPYLVLELVEGECIDRHCDARRLSVRRRLDLFDEVLAAVAYAHGQRVVHRNIKPSNIVVSADGAVKLLDFGIAKLLHAQATDRAITLAGQAAFTAHYAAPEQVRGEPVTAATDVYALGVLLHVLPAGRHPTAADTASQAEVIRATLDAVPMRLSQAFADEPGAAAEANRLIADQRRSTPAKLRRRLQGDLENIVVRALCKDPLRRYPCIEALAWDLRSLREHDPVVACVRARASA
jgi:eukaryotic-like serine/threonine-protein kinase